MKRSFFIIFAVLMMLLAASGHVSATEVYKFRAVWAVDMKTQGPVVGASIYLTTWRDWEDVKKDENGKHIILLDSDVLLGTTNNDGLLTASVDLPTSGRMRVIAVKDNCNDYITGVPGQTINGEYLLYLGRCEPLSPTTTPAPTTKPTTTTPPPTTILAQTTTTPPSNRCPEHMKWDGKNCIERCPSTSLEDYRAWDPVLEKCVDPATEEETTTPETSSDGCYKPSRPISPKEWLLRLFGKTDLQKAREKEEAAFNERLKQSPGTISFKKGRVLVERGIDIIFGNVGTKLKYGDTVVVEEGAEAAITLEGKGLAKVTEKTKHHIAVPKLEKERLSLAGLNIGNAWCGLKKLAKGETFEIDPGFKGGVRG